MTGGSAEEAEYLVSQSTHTCLSVLHGSGPQDAVLGLAKCSGSIRQQWYVQKGRWEWGGDRSLCLAPDPHKQGVCLVPCASTSVSWVLDSSEMMTCDLSLALDVPWEKPRTKIILYSKHYGNNQKWWLLSTLRNCTAPSDSVLPSALSHICQREARPDLHQCHQGASEPDYIISQSSHTLVTVLRGSSPNDAVVGMAPYNGNARQQWSLQGGQWKWGQDQTLCLTPNWTSNMLILAPCVSSPATWTMDHQGVVSCGSSVLDVPWEKPRQRLIVYPRHNGVNQKWWNLATLTAHIQSRSFPASNESVYKKEIACSLVNKLCHPFDPLPIKRSVSQFPGQVSPSAPRVTATLTLDLTTLGQRPNLRMTTPEDWQATDLYVPDGEAFQVVLPHNSISPEQASQITVRIGAHCDQLEPTSSNVSGNSFKRLPDVTEEFDVELGVNNFRSQFGGNLIFTFDEGSNFRVNVEVKNVVRTPHYILGKTSKREWKEMRVREVPHSVLESDSVVLVVPSSGARAIADPDHLLRRYNHIMHLLNDLAGFNSCDPPPRGRQWLVEDVQITAGSAHAGFPAMFCQEYYELCCPNTPHDWVTWHELGHNFQQGKWWSYAYGSESTVNLFSLYIQETLMGEDRLKKENKYSKTATAVDKGLTFGTADCWQKLVFLMEIKHAFPQSGWEMYRTVSRATRALSPKDAATLASNTQNQYDYVYELLSKAVGADLLPHYQRWGLQVSLSAQGRVRQLGLGASPADLAIRSH